MQRYDIHSSYGVSWIEEDDEGDYCRFTDHQAAIALKDAEIGRYRSVIARVVEAMDGPNEGFTYQLYLDCKAILKEGE